MKTQSGIDQNQNNMTANQKYPDLKGSGVYAASRDQNRSSTRDDAHSDGKRNKDSGNSRSDQRQDHNGNQKSTRQSPDARL